MSAAPGPWTGRRIHLVGIGGAGMSGWARVAVALGARVSGSDRADSPALAALRDLGVDVHVGHDAANVPPGADVFYSSAVPPENPERAAADPPARPRAELLRELTALKRVIAVAGAHGKTTTTSMIAHALLRCGMAPGYLIGGALRTTGQHADWGTGDWLVVEADESDRSMLRLHVDIAVALNVELDHHHTFASLQELREDFRTFLHGAQEAVVWDRADVVELAEGGEHPPRVTAFAERAVVLEPGGSRSAWRGHEVRLRVPGRHNARNATAALEACRLAGADEAAAVAALADFPGAGRRFERLGTTPSGAVVVDDYAHHPTEVAATLAAAGAERPERLVAVFQPHLFSRTAELHREFAAALSAADLVAVLDVYPARERAEDFPGVDRGLIAAAVTGPRVLAARTIDEAAAELGPLLREGDLVLVMGAGDVDRLGRKLVG